MRVKLEDVCDKGSSNLKQSNVINKNGSYSVYGASGYVGSIDTFHQSKPYVAVVKDGAGIGRAMLLPEKTSVIGTMQYLLPKDNILPEYLYYVLKAKHLEKYFSGATIPHIYFKNYKNEEFELVSFDKQKEIISRIKMVESIIEKLSNELNLLDELVKARFSEMFDDYTKVVSLDDLTMKITDGSHNPPKSIEKSQYIMLSSQNIYDKLDFSDVRYLSEKDFLKENKRTLVEEGDVLLTIVGTVGRTHVVLKGENYVFQRSVGVIKPNKEILNSVYLAIFLKTNYAKQQLEMNSHGSSQKGIYLQDLKKIKVLLPPLSLQNQFADFVRETDKSRLV